MNPTYEAILAKKRLRAVPSGFSVDTLDTPPLFPFQANTVKWSLALGRSAMFAETGLGKGPMLLTWSHHVAKHTGDKVLVLAPLAVGHQLVREAVKFGIPDVAYGKHPDQFPSSARVLVTNYENINKFEGVKFGGIVAEEGSILANFMGKVSQYIVSRARVIPYRLITTATPSPNDWTELGMHADFLGYGTTAEMRARFMVNDASDTKEWRLKKHAVKDFWRWVASWARSITKPSDVGDYDDGPYVLPPLNEQTHIVGTDLTKDAGDGLFRMAEMSATGFHEERRRTAADRSRRVAEIVAGRDGQWLIWTDTDYDAEAVKAVVPDAVEVSGKMKDEVKEERLMGFADGKIRVLLTKPKIAGMGLNLQGCHNMVFAGPSYSFKDYWQATRRCYRFGQTKPVNVHVVCATTEANVWRVVHGKKDRHHEMQREMIEASRLEAVERNNSNVAYNPNHTLTLPNWIHSR